MNVTYTVLSAGREVVLAKDFAKSVNFHRGEILGPAKQSTVESLITDGGYYHVKPLDGSEFIADLHFMLHRSTFVPVGTGRIAKRRAEKKLRARRR